MKPLNLIGQKFGNLLVISRQDNSKHGKSRWLCQCSCGNKHITFGSLLTRGESKSCGCLRSHSASIVNTKHGMSNSRTYRIWKAMLSRCRNKNTIAYQSYGAKGIIVCDHWLSFENFFSDMGEAPANKSIDRIDNNKGYEPSNCRWATSKEQSINSSVPRYISFNGETHNISEWASIIGINPVTLLERLNKWPIEKALTTKKLR